jgi:hypothetical protein
MLTSRSGRKRIFDGEPYSLAVTGRFATFGKIAWIAAAKYAARLPLCIATR